MFNSLNNVDWDLLHQQKLVLLRVLDGMDRDSPTAEALWGLVHLLDALQDDAAEAGRWTFPSESQQGPTNMEAPAAKRYYVEDDEGHHHGPMDDYEEAASVADAIHGRIIAQEVDPPAGFPEEEKTDRG